MSTAHISIVMATRNVAHDLSGAIKSLEDYAPQSPVFIWDGESSDDTLNILRAEHSRITRWGSGPDQGIYDAFQKALNWVETPFVYFMGADDRLRSDWTVVAKKVQNDHIIYYSDVWLTTKKERYNGAFTQMDLARTNICQQAIVYPTKIFPRHPFCLEYPMQADWELNMWCQSQSDLQWEYVNACICDFNDLTGKSSVTYDHKFNRDYPALLRHYFPFKAFIKYGLVSAIAHHTRKVRGKA